ncbi:amino acid adenylation domain-containing protein [Motilimonas cestriensis]|uniref:Amino acid adenylation domain-containing protein n=1 Tax=Motilimonas cestriensis TaxID=2742685 RepID=A0ABS8WGW0_9GAMM|nr:non-ribosomal peptide synthetase [Motilimonas cestriensis]MCE2597006.1 amino acid adenylation domain-containing protein [Motilimonas cestriensis]
MTDIISLLTALERQGVRLMLNEQGQLTSQSSKAAMTPAIGQQIKMNKDAIVDCLAAKGRFEQPIKATGQSIGPLSSSQSGLWFIEQYEENSHLYNMPVHFRLTGQLDVAALQYSFNSLVQKHASLRTRFVKNAQGKGEQHISSSGALQINHKNLMHLPIGEREAKLKQLVIDDINQPFALAAGELTRVTLVQLQQDEHLLMLTQHHIISDGWSVKNMFADLKQAFLAFQNGQRTSPEGAFPAVTPTKLNYLDYANWFNSADFLDYHNLHKAFWVERLRGIPEVHSLPLDKPRPAHHNNDGALVFSAIELSTWERFKHLCQRYSTSNYIGLHSVFSLLMARVSANNDIVIGTPLAYRERHEIEDVVGFFVNTIVLRTQVPEQQSFADYLKACREQDLAAFDHQLYRFEALSEAIGADRTTAINPIFQIMLVYQAKVDFNDLIPGCGAVEEPSPVLPAKTDISLKVTELVDGVKLEWLYSTGIFEHQMVQNLADTFVRLLESVLASPEQDIWQLPIIANDYEQRVAAQLAALPSDYQRAGLGDTCLAHHLFEHAAQNYPEHLAVRCQDQALTYAELEQQANQLAHWLQQQGVGKEQRIGIVALRDEVFPIAALAIWKAGGAYVPLDPDYPPERLTHIINDAELTFILAPSATFAQQHPHLSATIIDLSGPESRAAIALCPATSVELSSPQLAQPNQLAYVIYTSGSTGLPKGVMVEHGAFVNLMQDHLQRLQINAESVMFNCMSLSFDAGNMTAMLPLMAGATLAFGEPNERLLTHSETLKATHMIISTALFAALPVQPLSYLRVVAIGGEACPTKLVDNWASQLTLHNMYGPTEFTVTALVQPLLKGAPVTIGHSIQHCAAVVLDGCGNLCAQGVPGELCLAGIGLARGYLNQPELTERVFTEQWVAGQRVRLYHTGDKARVRHNGEVEFMGRLDQQVKLRGYRIELGEIESQLAQVAPYIQQVKALVVEQGNNPILVAYASCKANAQRAPSSDILRAVAAKLPEYMVPVHLMFVDTMPLNPNGKVDVTALPALTIRQGANDEPASESERQVLDLWRKILNCDCGVEDDFFRLGGDSILSIQLTTQLRAAGFECSVKDVFESKTVRRLCQHLQQQQTELMTIDAETGVLTGEFPILPIQAWFNEQAYVEPNHWNQAVILEIPDLNDSELSAMMEQLMLHHDALRLSLSAGMGGETQRYSDLPVIPPLTQLNASQLSESELYDALTQLQGEMDYSQGKVLAWARISGHPLAQHGLFLAFHHWVIDAVSWRIISEDLRALAQGHRLPAKTSSLRQWGEGLANYAASNESQFDYWLGQSQGVDYQDLRTHAALPSLRQAVKLSLSKAQTQDLIHHCHQAFNTEVNDLLIAALTKTLTDMGWGENHIIMLEGHGREAIAERLDVSRTVGWFTSTYPVKMKADTELSRLIKQCKEQVRSVPLKGVGFNAFRQFHPEGKRLTISPIVFNYLGLQTQQQGQWRPLPIEPGQVMSALNQPAELISLHGGIINGQLTLRQVGALAYPLSQRFMGQLTDNILALISHCQQVYKKVGEQKTCSDYPLVKLSQGYLEQLQAQQNIAMLLPASSLQQSMWAHRQRCPNDDAYHLQTPITYRQRLNINAYQQAWLSAIARFPALRVVLIEGDGGKEHTPLIQLVRAYSDHLTLPISVTDLCQSEDPARIISSYKADDLARGFNLSQGPLLRIAVFKLSQQEFEVVFSCHHAIIDGWSGPRLFAAVHQAYANIMRSAATELSKGDQVLTSVEPDHAYLEQAAYGVKQAARVATYWQEKGVEQQFANDLTGLFESDFSAVTQQSPAVVRQSLNVEQQAQLALLAQKVGVTTSVVVQYAWHRLIARMTGALTTIVGNVTSGRDLPVDRIGESVGLYINSLPLILSWPDGNEVSAITLGDHITQLQTELMSVNQHATQSLIGLQRGRGRLFQSLFVYENYPRPSAKRDQNSASDELLQPEFGAAYEKVEFPLNLVVSEMSGVTQLRFEFDRHQIEPTRAEYVLSLWLAELNEVIAQDWQTPVTVLVSGDGSRQTTTSNSDTSLAFSPSSATAQQVLSLWCDVAGLPLSERYWQWPLSECAIDSLNVIRLAARLSERFAAEVSISEVYQYPTPAAMTDYLMSHLLENHRQGGCYEPA